MTDYRIAPMKSGGWLVIKEGPLDSEYLGAAPSLEEVTSVLVPNKILNKSSWDMEARDKLAVNLMGLAHYNGETRVIETVKAIRSITGCGLKEAKDSYDKAKGNCWL